MTPRPGFRTDLSMRDVVEESGRETRRPHGATCMCNGNARGSGFIINQAQRFKIVRYLTRDSRLATRRATWISTVARKANSLKTS